MDYTLKAGDYVRHNNPTINGGLKMCVDEVNEDGTEANALILQVQA